ncbi:unnamed protein product [Nezara viridula]|uniref:Uncharacterized protein n=1 Tax=Nezara viridula TaxID=85310 RepID=A0A9P0HTA5_NEZVI|nr:unnamed protein product [Nezara viridula]
MAWEIVMYGFYHKLCNSLTSSEIHCPDEGLNFRSKRRHM